MDQPLDDAEGESFGAQADSLSPLEVFIRDELNTFTFAKDHTRLLLDAAKRRKLRPQKIGWTKVSTFALSPSSAQAAGIHGRVTPLVSHQALRAASSRELTRQCLVLSQVPHLPGKTFHGSRKIRGLIYRTPRQAGEHPAPSPTSLSGGEAFLPWVPLYVVGDGTQTLSQLAAGELERRSSCSFLPPLKGTDTSDVLAHPGAGS